METLFGLILLFCIIVYVKQKNKPPRYGTQEYLDDKYKNLPPNAAARLKAAEKKAMTCTYGDIPLTPSEEAAVKRHNINN